MTYFNPDAVRPAEFEKFVHPTPEWFTRAKLGVFLHWGAYSVAAWAELAGELGTGGDADTFCHKPYSEWYFNTIRLDSPARAHHQEVFGGAPYEVLLDQWKAENFDPDDVLALIASIGARYFIPVTKHHDGIALWNAPRSEGWNTVDRGPHRDLIGAFAEAARKTDVRFCVYYSGGLDWHFRETPPLEDSDLSEERTYIRANDDEYARYAYDQVTDLIDRYKPSLIWNDIDWPDAGKNDKPYGLIPLFQHYYDAVPDGVLNDRWGETHWDYETTEYQRGNVAPDKAWENTRGTGYSFGYNQLEDESHTITPAEAAKYFVDVVSCGGNLLLNIGLMADGTVPPLQRRTLEGLAAWNDANGAGVFDSTIVDVSLAWPSDVPWVRWTQSGQTLNGFIDADGTVQVPAHADALDLTTARDRTGAPIDVRATKDGTIEIDLPTRSEAGPRWVRFDLR
jgi:alpha-L-fucosidase